jgi:TM2 domain-containing membrane protein YozV
LEELKRIPTVVAKYPVVAAGASFFQPGLGQILCGRLMRGILFLLPHVGLYLIIYALNIVSVFGYIDITKAARIQQFFMFVHHITEFIVRIWATYDAYNLTKVTANTENTTPISESSQ